MVPTAAECNALVALYGAGLHFELEKRALQLIAEYPDFGFTWKVLGAALQAQGKDALPAMERAARLLPDDAEAHSNLGAVLKKQGRLVEATASYRRALEIEPGVAALHSTLGNTLANLGRLEEAVASHRRALEIDPDYAEGHNSLGIALKDLGKLDDAVASYQRALAIKPDLAEAHCNLGNALHCLKRLDLALSCCRRALELRPHFAEAHNNLANILRDLGQLNDAEAGYRRALAIRPGFAEAHFNLGRVLKELGQTDLALASFRRALEIEPGLAEAHAHLTIILIDLGRIEEAVASCRVAALSFPELAFLAELLQPAIPQSSAAIDQWRERFRIGTANLMAFPGQVQKFGNEFYASYFHLAYHGHDDRPLVEALNRMLRAKAPALGYVAPHVANWRHPGGSRRIRVGFCSEYLVAHTIGKLYAGFLRHLDRNRFEVILIHAPDAKGAQIDRFADRVLRLPAELADQQRVLGDEKLDVLFFPDIGMSQATYLLACARLAPVQAVSWGHPDTTGIDTLDYFLSAEAIEPDGAEDHYSERLIKLSRLPCFYQPLLAPTQIPSRTALGLPAEGTLYGCPQSLYKLHPEFDAVLADIATGDPNGHIVLLAGVAKNWGDLLRQRWAASHPILNERVIFLPRLPLDRFMALIAHFDVLLDPIHFGSGNTLYEALVYGTPIVTWPGRFMRGRIVAGAYQQMGLADAPIAAGVADYAPLALALGRDPARRATLRKAIVDGSKELFADHAAVREFEEFLVAATAAAGRGEKLPIGWRATLERFA